jgi:two-component system chemotaxis sensor kinase CheA
MDKPNPDNRGEFFDQFLDDYYAECDEHLVSIRRSLVTLEDEVDTRTVDRTLLDNLFRSFHTLKGISGMVGLAKPNNSHIISKVTCASCVKGTH